ncbi:MAG: DASS family sodium-coupled anion symporter [Syntrophobacteraceae bacterium]|jgi:anion transporter
MSERFASFEICEQSILKRYGLLIALAALSGLLLIPVPHGLSVAGHRILALLVFSVVLWVTEGVSYPVSGVIIATLMTFLIGMSPNPEKAGVLYGTSQGLTMALGGFSNTAWALVGAALFLAAAMTKTGLDRRIALKVLSLIGTSTNRILIGVILVGFVLSFFVPSTTARVACLVPIVMGIITAFGVDRSSRFAAMLMIATAQADSIWNVGIKTAAAQNMIAVNFIKQQLGYDITWLEWFIAAAPYAAIMSVALFFVLTKLLPPDLKEIPGGREIVRKQLAALGPMSAPEKKLLCISIALLFFWTTEKILHDIDTSSSTLAAIALMMLPRLGIMTWEEAQKRIAWGTLFLFGIGISLGSAMVSTKAGVWLAKAIVPAFGLSTATALMIVLTLAAFLIIVHLGFASASGLSAAMIPIIIEVLKNVSTPGLNVIGMTMILQYVISFGFILPVNAPQNMIAFGTNTFSVPQFIRTGIPLTIIAYLLIALLSATYWKFLGLV